MGHQGRAASLAAARARGGILNLEKSHQHNDCYAVMQHDFPNWNIKMQYVVDNYFSGGIFTARPWVAGGALSEGDESEEENVEKLQGIIRF